MNQEVWITLAVIFGVIAAIGIILLFGLLLRHIVIPVHDKMWKHKRKKAKKTTLKELFMDGLFFLMMLLWFPFILILTAGSLYIAIISIIQNNILNSLLGILLTVLFGSKLFFMLEHRHHAEERWKRKRKK